MKDQYQTVGLVGYEAPDPDRLYLSVQKMAQYWSNKEDRIKLLEAALKSEDRERGLTF